MTSQIPLTMFDADSGTYRFRSGEKLPSVTGVLRSSGIIPDLSHLDPAFRQRGSDVHLMTERMDDGLSLEDARAQQREFSGYFDAWALFRQEHPFRVLLMEKMLYHATFLYCGKPDRFVCFDTPFGPRYGIIDIKTGSSIRASLYPQTAAYAELCRANFVPSISLSDFNLWGVQLASDGRYRILPVLDNTEHLHAFLSSLHVLNWKRKHDPKKIMYWEEVDV